MDQKTLKELVHYDPESGVFTQLRSNSPRLRTKCPRVLDPRPNGDGYAGCMLEGVSYTLHRLAVLYMTGKFPEKHERVDHEDKNRLNNRWKNLRVVSQGANIRNQDQEGKPTESGYTGVSLVKAAEKAGRERRWRAHIRVDKKLINLGLFRTPEEAYAVRKKAHEEQMLKIQQEFGKKEKV